jgi:competence protein ComEA
VVRGPPKGDPKVERANKARGERKGPAAGGLVNLNTATKAELESLPGIGAVLAGRIIDARPFGSVDDRDRVKGIGAKRLAELRSLVTVD